MSKLQGKTKNVGMNKKSIFTKLRRQGLTYKEIGKIHNVSRQRVHQVIMGYQSILSEEAKREKGIKAYLKIKENPLLYKKYYKRLGVAIIKWRKENPDKVKAYRKVFVAIRNKTLKRKPCFCGELRSEAHHEDYSKPLEVNWLCKRHHIEADKKRKKISTGKPIDNVSQ